MNKNSKIQMQHAVQQHKLQNAICCPSILTVIIKTKILSFFKMHLVFCVDKTKKQFISSLILYFSSLFWTAAESICVQRGERGKRETAAATTAGRPAARARTLQLGSLPSSAQFCLWQQGKNDFGLSYSLWPLKGWSGRP